MINRNSINSIIKDYPTLYYKLSIPSILINPKTNRLIIGKKLELQSSEKLNNINIALDSLLKQIPVYFINI